MTDDEKQIHPDYVQLNASVIGTAMNTNVPSLFGRVMKAIHLVHVIVKQDLHHQRLVGVVKTWWSLKDRQIECNELDVMCTVMVMFRWQIDVILF